MRIEGLRNRRVGRRMATDPPTPHVRARPSVTALAGCAVLAWFLAPSGSALLTANLICVYAVAAIGLSIVYGLGGLVSIAQGAIMGVGAYLFMLLFGDAVGFVPALLIACVGAALASGLTGVLATRVQSHYFILLSLLFGEAVVLIATNETELTGGAEGTAIQSAPTVFGLHLSQPESFWPVAVALLVVVWYLADTFRASRVGLGLSASRVDEYLAAVDGVNYRRYRVIATVIGGAFGGLAGAMLGAMNGYIGPADFGLNTAILLILIVVLAGPRARGGSVVLSAGILTWLSQGLLTLTGVGMLIYGLGLVLVTVLASEGLGGIADRLRQTIGNVARRSGKPQVEAP